MPTILQRRRLLFGQSRSLKTGLMAWYDLTANANDQHGSNNLTNNNGVTFDDTGATFVYANNKSLTIADNAALSIGLGKAFLECCWITPATLPTNTSSGIIAKNSAGTERTFRIRSSGADLHYVFDIGNGTTSTSVFHTTTPVSGTRVFAYWGWNPATGKVFCGINSTLIESNLALGVVDSSSVFRIGSMNNGEYYYALDGVVRSYGLWNLTQSQLNYYLRDGGISRLRNGGVPLDYSQLS
jgi:hypothetical protein